MNVNLNLGSSPQSRPQQTQPAVDFELKSPDEIRQMTEALRVEANSLTDIQDANEKTLREQREQLKTKIPNITEIQEIANRRAEQLERRRRFEKKILSIYNRFPSILNADQPQIISTDISILTHQLQLIEKRNSEAKAKIADLEKKKERFQQVIVDLRRQNRLQDDLMTQRKQDKDNLSNNLEQELNGVKTLYHSDIKTIDRKTTNAEGLTNELETQLTSLKTNFDLLTKQRSAAMQSAPNQNAKVSQKIAFRQQDLIKSIEQFTLWWTGRRMLRHLNDRIDFLNSVGQKTQESFDQSYKSIEFITHQNASRIEELKSLQNMNTQLANSIKEKQVKRKDLEEKKSNLLKSFKPLPKDIDQQLKSLREQQNTLDNRAKSLDIELQVLGVNSGPSAADKRYEETRRHYRSQIQEAASLRKEIDQLKKKLADQEAAQQSHFVQPLTSIQDGRLLLSDDQPYTVVAASLDLLEKLVFHPGNTDDNYYTGLLVYIHTQKNFDMPMFVQSLISFFNSTEFVTEREDRLKGLIEIWRKWFPNDFSESRALLSPLVNLAGTSSIYDTHQQMKINIIYNINVPFNAKETKIPFSASPLIIAEHFTFLELCILREIPAYEFIGCSWTSSEKWNKAPHIMKFFDHFNFISQWIVYSIIKTESVDERVLLIEQWIQIMDAAAEVVNYQLVFEIYGALCNPAITHLTSTWSGINPEIMSIYKKYSLLTTPSGRFANYREKLEQLPPEVVVPYIGPFLTSLVYISDGNTSTKSLPGVPEPVINFQKFRSYAAVLNDIMVPWGKDMVFYLHEDLLKRIQNIPPVDLSESELFQLSQKLKS